MRALILVDIQYDFLPGGALAVPHGDEVIPVANAVQSGFDLVVATQDWHPANHGSFAANHPAHKAGDVIDLGGLPQVLWPVHCVQDSQGARIASALNVDEVAQVFRKGTDPSIDSYSGLFDNGHRKATGLDQWLKERAVTDVFVAGLATDYCVKYTALDAHQLGFRCHVIIDGCRGVDLHPGDVDHALDELKKAGVLLVESTDLRNR